MKWQINWNLQCEIDIRKDDCKREAPHCHISRNGIRVAQVFLSPVDIKSGHSLDHNEIGIVKEFVQCHCSDLKREYERVRDS